eukprot:9479914-Pyramimonas_sp.AAC.2
MNGGRHHGRCNAIPLLLENLWRTDVSTCSAGAGREISVWTCAPRSRELVLRRDAHASWSRPRGLELRYDAHAVAFAYLLVNDAQCPTGKMRRRGGGRMMMKRRREEGGGRRRGREEEEEEGQSIRCIPPASPPPLGKFQ